jgi:hypothetical protein
LLLFTTSKINNQNNDISHHNQVDNSPASIYQNYNEQLTDSEFYIHPELHNNRILYDYHSDDLSYLDHSDELNEASNYYSEYYRARLQELCDLSLKKANNKSMNKINHKENTHEKK